MYSNDAMIALSSQSTSSWSRKGVGRMDRATAIEVLEGLRAFYAGALHNKSISPESRAECALHAEALQLALTDMREAQRKEEEENHA
jgi:hypothetical protein